MGRLLALVGGIVWLAALALLALLVQRSQHTRTVRPLTTVPVLLQELNAHGPTTSEPWSVTRATSAHHVLIVEVTAARMDDARAIAADIVRRMTARGYDEVLVYFWNAKEPGRFADRRVQWTRTAGYTELAIGN